MTGPFFHRKTHAPVSDAPTSGVIGAKAGSMQLGIRGLAGHAHGGMDPGSSPG